MATLPTEGATLPAEGSLTPTEEATTSTNKKSSKSALIVGAVILGLLIIAGGTGAIVYYATKKKEEDDVPTYVINQQSAADVTDVTWPNCAGQIFVNQDAKKLYSINVRIYDKYNYGPMHVELYDGVVGTASYIAKSSSKDGQGWTTFDFPTYPILQIADHTYSFIIVPENKQTISTWYNDNADLEQGKIIYYNYTTYEHSERPTGTSLTFQLYATTYATI